MEFFSIVGCGITLAQWLDTLRHRRKEAAEGEREETIDHYLEWLRRERHTELLERLDEAEDARETISRLISEAMSETEEGFERILQQLRENERLTHTKLDSIGRDVGQIKQMIRLFPQAAGASQEEREFEEEYLKRVAGEYGRVRMIGVREMRSVKQSLSLAYVSLTMTSGADDEEPRRAEELLLDQDLLTVRGNAGSGKTTLLNWVALQCTKTRDEENAWRGGMPFVIPLRKLEADDRGRPSIGRFTQYTIDPKLWPKSGPGNWVTTVLEAKRGVVLIDGVDELPAAVRPGFWEWLAEFVDNYPGNRVYVTSRYFRDSNEEDSEVHWNPPGGFGSADLDDMNDADVRTFITNWHNAVLRYESEDRERLDLEVARDRLPERLLEPVNRRVRELCRTPLLCALVCAIHWRESGYLPRKRVDLYERCCLMLIEERDTKRNIAAPEGPVGTLELGDKELILQRLALDMMRNELGKPGQDHQIEVSREEAVAWIGSHLGLCSSEEARKCEPDAVVDHLIERTGLLREPAKDRVDFPHRTFQEYLAACAAGATLQAGDLAKRAADDQWHETIVLAAGTKVGGVQFGNSLVEKLVEKGEQEVAAKRSPHAYFALAVACLETGQQIREELRKQVLRHLEEIVPPRNHKEAEILSAAGEAILPLLEHYRWRYRGAKVVAACARVIALIGTERAADMLQGPGGYGNDRRATVLTEICQCPGVHPLRVPAITDLAQGWYGGLPKSVGPYITDLSPFAEIEETGWTYPELHLKGCTGITDLAPLATLPSLTRLHLSGCTGVTDLTPLASLSNLRSLQLGCCTRVTDLTALAGLANLRELHLSDCTGVTDLAPLRSLANLTELELSGCRGVTDLAPLAGLSSLTELELSDCTRVTELAPLANLSSLTELRLRNCRGVTDLTPLTGLSSLTGLQLFGCSGVSDLAPLARLPSLTELRLLGCTGVTDLTSLASSSSLTALHLWSCTDITALRAFTALNRLGLFGCVHITDLAPLASLTNLTTLELWRCKRITNLTPLASLSSLKRLTLVGSTRIKDFGPLSTLPVGCTIILEKSVQASVPKEVSQDRHVEFH